MVNIFLQMACCSSLLNEIDSELSDLTLSSCESERQIGDLLPSEEDEAAGVHVVDFNEVNFMETLNTVGDLLFNDSIAIKKAKHDDLMSLAPFCKNKDAVMYFRSLKYGD